ncbi:hypothetical protein GOP47_0014841 [Adiantum capillus-veneris]|uniref:acetyl-CoA carboxytransferase n=1 Tax=Adiantum capillus-veneris TaxID=13818 RepID=A0A9D4UM95_ADICA|nr:hypothetical protein GOP47_0014841 [Adiantum capillus-veneris]
MASAVLPQSNSLTSAKCSLVSPSRNSNLNKVGVEASGEFLRLQSSKNGVNQSLHFGLVLRVGQEDGRGCRKPRKTTAMLKKGGRKTPDKEYPWPQKMKPEDLMGSPLRFLSRFKPLPQKPKPVHLPFELPLVDIQKKIQEVRELANSTGMDFSIQLNELQEKYDEVRRDLYSQLSPVQRLSVARHPNRPTCLDHVLNITDKWLELHGDRAGYDDPAIITGIGQIEGMSFMFIGHQKGRNTKENIYRNFAMPTPNGYRKALRMMQHAAHHGFPILTFVDTPGAYAGIQAEERGQGEAIARNLREMFGLRVPIITTVIGEGGSGGALAIGCCDKMLMLENSVYYVASPEACAAILWKTAAAAPQATEALKITAHELVKLDVVDEIIPEPLGGAHSDPLTTSMNMKTVIMKHMRELLKMEPDPLLAQRVAKFRKIGSYQEGVKVDPRFKRNMKPRDAPMEMGEPKLLPSHVHQNLELSLKTASTAATTSE